ncbi:MAG: tetratricopeptide repeat protein [Candidatus Fermentibacteraceae bacterium]
MSERADRTRQLSTALILLLVLGSGYLFRMAFAGAVLPPPPRMQGETTQAYRYARMVSRGEDVPGRDMLVLHPQGFPTGRNSIFEEYLAGWTHRLAGGDFDGFIRAFSRLFPLLAAVGAFMWLRAAGFGRAAALLCAAAYAVVLPALLRARGESLYRETVALPMLAFLGASLERSLRGGGPRWHASAAALLFLSLAAWKVTAFLALFLFAYLAVRQTVRGDVPRGLALSLAGSQLAASLVLSHMRADTAILSPSTAMAAAAAASVLLRRSWWVPAAGGVMAVVFGILGPESTGHVTSVVLAKLRFPGGHPPDPGMLSADARLFWVSGYTSPSAGQILWLFAVPAAVAAPGFRRLLRRAKGGLILPFAVLSLAGYLFFDRLAVFGALAVCLLMAGTFSSTRALAVAGMVLLGAHSLTADATARLLSRSVGRVGGEGSTLTEKELSELLVWARDETGEEEAFLCYWHLSGMISAYAHRPVVTHTFFESARNRRRIQRFARAMYGPEDSVLAMMADTRADYVIYQADFLFDRSPEGLLYLAGRREVPDGSAALLMHYAPERLDSLTLAYRGSALRVYARQGPATDADSAGRPLFDPLYYQLFGGSYSLCVAAATDPGGTARQLALSGREAGDPVPLSAALALLAEAGAASSDGLAVLQELAAIHMRGGWDIGRLREDFARYLYAWGPDPQARLDLAQLLLEAGRPEEAARQLETAAGALGETARVRALRRRILGEGEAG